MSEAKEKLNEKKPAKSVEIKSSEEVERLRQEIFRKTTHGTTTLRPLPKIDARDKGKGIATEPEVPEKDSSDDDEPSKYEGLITADKAYILSLDDEEYAKRDEAEWNAEEDRKLAEA